MSDLPAPLIASDTDIAGLDGFLLDVHRLFSSELWALSTGDEFKAALALWGRAWQQIPPGSLPDDERVLAAFSGAGAKWRKVRDMALRGFVKCSDGRLYHSVLCEDVRRAAEKRLSFRARTNAATEARKKAAEEARKREEHRRKHYESVLDDRNGDDDDDRYVDRNDHVPDDVTVDVTSLQRQRQRQGQGQKEDSERAAALPGEAALLLPLGGPADPGPVGTAGGTVQSLYPALDLKSQIFSHGLAYLTQSGLPDPDARKMLGMWRSRHGDPALIDALAKANGAASSDPVAFIQKILSGGSHATSRNADREAAAADSQRRRREGIFGALLADGLEVRGADPGGDGDLDDAGGGGPRRAAAGLA